MNIVDLVLIIYIGSSIYFGYKKGLLRELYDLAALVIALVMAYFLKGTMTNYLNTYFDFNKIFKLDIEQSLYQMLLNITGTLIGFTYAFILIFILYKIIFFLLMKRKIIKIKSKKYNWGGSIISFLKAFIFATVIVFNLSFAFLVNYGFLYEESLLAKPILHLNPPLYKTSNNIIQIYKDAQSLSDIVKLQGSLTDSKEIIAVLRNVMNNPLITDELIIEASKTAINNDKEVNVSNIDIVEFKTNFKEQSNYPVFKAMYGEKLIDDDLIYKILKANQISGITKEEVHTIFN